MLAEAEYRRRAAVIRGELQALEARWRRVAVLRASSFLLAFVMVVWSFSGAQSLRVWALLPLLGFVLTIFWHSRIDSRRRRCERRVDVLGGACGRRRASRLAFPGFELGRVFGNTGER